MKRLITHESLAHIGHLKNLLEHSGIVCVIRNDQLSGGLGEIPFLECLPVLWVVRDQDLLRAEALLAAAEKTSEQRKKLRVVRSFIPHALLSSFLRSE